MLVGGGILTCAMEFIWECVENSEFVLEKYRRSIGTSTDYKGDSYQNSLGTYLIRLAHFLLAAPFFFKLTIIFSGIKATRGATIEPRYEDKAIGKISYHLKNQNSCEQLPSKFEGQPGDELSLVGYSAL